MYIYIYKCNTELINIYTYVLSLFWTKKNQQNNKNNKEIQMQSQFYKNNKKKTIKTIEKNK